jgi:hypothetical protein
VSELRERMQELVETVPVTPSPLRTLERRAQRYRARRATIAAIVACSFVALTVGATSYTRGSHRVTVIPQTRPSKGADQRAPLGAPTTFVSTRRNANGQVVVATTDATSGRIVQTLFDVPGGSAVTGTAVKSSDEVWITVSRAITTDTTRPYCESEVVSLNAATGQTRTIWSEDHSHLVEDAQPSPTGDRIAYVLSDCSNYRANSFIQIRDLSNGGTTTLGEGLARCEFLSSPRWSSDGSSIAFNWSETSTGRSNQGVPCDPPLSSRLVVTAADTSQNVPRGQTVQASSGCLVDSVAITEDGFATVEQCARADTQLTGQFVDGSVHVVRYDNALNRLAIDELGVCGRTASIAGTRQSNVVIVASYQNCPEPNGSGTTRIFKVAPGRSSQIAAERSSGLAVDHISF